MTPRSQESPTDDSRSSRITRLLIAWSDGDQQAHDELVPLIYDRLRRLASSFLRHERQDHTLETSSLVHEAYLRLVDQQRVRWRDRAHFFAIAGRMMRRILVDHSRRRASAKRGSEVEKIALAEAEDVPLDQAPDLLALDEALRALAKTNREAAQLVELRYFGGLTKEEAAEVMGISSATVIRRWRLIRAWLHSYLVKGEHHEL